MTVGSCSPSATRRETPFQSVRNSCHHSRSDLAGPGSLVQTHMVVRLSNCCTQIKQLPKKCPATSDNCIDACCSWPASNSKSHLVQCFFWNHSLTLASLTWCSRSSPWIVSISIWMVCYDRGYDLLLSRSICTYLPFVCKGSKWPTHASNQHFSHIFTSHHNSSQHLTIVQQGGVFIHTLTCARVHQHVYNMHTMT